MKYQYKCKKCDKFFAIEKPMKLASREEKCPECGEILTRIFTSNLSYPSDLNEVCELSARMRHSRPSGREKLIY